MGRMENVIAAAKAHKAERTGPGTIQGVCPKDGAGMTLVDIHPEHRKGTCRCGADIRVETWPELQARRKKAKAEAKAKSTKKAKAEAKTE